MWKELTWHYVIEAPSLAAQQYGQRRVIDTLFRIFREEARSKNWAIFPAGYREHLVDSGDDEKAITRAVVDIISGMTERAALELYHKLTGIAPGSVLDAMVE